MSKQEFMKELESLLSDIPLEEREEALRYYDGYFEDAGKEHEDEIIKELGSPEKVARIIKSELMAGAEDARSKGYFTERGYRPVDELGNEYEIVKSDKQSKQNGQTEGAGFSSSFQNGQAHQESGKYQNNSYQSSAYQNNDYQNNNHYNNSNQNTFNQSNSSQTQAAGNSSNRAIIILIAVCTSFIWGPFVLGAAGVAIGIITAILGILLGFGAVGVCLMVTGISLCISGLIQISMPVIGALLIGSGLLILGIGMLFTLAFIMICRKVPAVIRGFVDLCSRPFKNRRAFV